MSCLHKYVVNLYITDEVDTCSKDLNIDFTLHKCFFGAVKLTKKADPDRYKYSGYDIGFNFNSQFSWTDISMEKSVIIFIVRNSFFVHVDGRNKNILVFGEGLTQGLSNVTIIVEARYPMDFKESEKRFVSSPHYNESNSFLFVNTVKYIILKQKIQK